MDFQKEYSREKFSDFLRDKFLSNDFRIKEEQLDIPFKSSLVKKVVKLGNVNSLNLKVYEIQHKSEHDPRVTLTREAFRLMANYGTRKALAIFVSKSSPNYRFSLITVDLDLEGKRVTKAYSNPKRYSFFLGPDAKTHTPKKFLIKEGRVENFEDLLSRFNVEVVTKEFFDKYKDLFDKLSDYLKKDHAFQIFAQRNRIDTDNFAKKLLGQIVFLYFLQRKGWLGAKKGDKISNGDRDFLRNLFNKSRKEKLDFFNHYLEHLFYNALNKKPEKAGSFYREYFDCQIPFLNGGLFEPLESYDWEDEHLHIPSKLFSSSPDNPEKGDGILDVFDLYNFTVYESDPIDKEVSIDPEMLGKVFENLLEENLRKGKGTYYTPREIVHYMCQESLINYLQNEVGTTSRSNIEDLVRWGELKINENGEREQRMVALNPDNADSLENALENIKVVDPACGSGAFLVGTLQEIVKARLYLSYIRDEKTSDYELKKETIQNCIYGVDIDPGAVEIAKLRLWLSLVVDFELEDIEPLPNLDYKIMQGNSLLEELVIGDTSIKLFDSNLIKKAFSSERMKNLFEKENQQGLFDGEKDGILKELKRLQLKYYEASDIEEKRELRKKIDEIENSLIEESVKGELKNLQEQRFHLKSMPEIGLTDQDVRKLQKISSKEEQILSILEEVQKSGTKPFFLWHLHFSDVFEEKGGFDVVIANPPYNELRDLDRTTQDNYRKSPFYIYAKSGRVNLFQFFYPLSISIAKKKGIVTLITQNSILAENSTLSNRKYIIENTKIIKFVSFPERDNPKKRVFESAKMSVCIGILQKITNIPRDYSFDILVWYDKYFNEGHKLSLKLSDVKTLFPDKLILPLSTEKSFSLLKKFKNKESVFYVNSKSGEVDMTKYKDRFNTSRNGYRVLTGAQVLKYKISDNPSQGKVLYLEIDLSEFPGGKRENIKDERIVMQRITGVDSKIRLIMTLIPGKILCANSTNYIPKQADNDMGYILAVLNSSLVNWLFKQTSTNTNITTGEINNIPIPKIENSGQKSFSKIVNRILKITNKDNYLKDKEKASLVKQLDNQIDQMVYKLYGLTPEEIKIVEGKNE